MRFGIWLLMMLAAVGTAFAQENKETITVDGLDRTYTVRLPKGYDEKQHYPAVILFHGRNQDADDMARLTRFNELADKDSVITIYPNALHGAWNFGVHETTRIVERPGPYRRRPYGYPGRYPGRYPPTEGRVERQRTTPADDVEFVDKMLDKLGNKYAVDKTRIYATGISDGGFMAMKVGCSLADRVAATAPVAAAMPKLMTCLPARPIPTILINGTDDPVVKYGGAGAKNGRVATISAEDTAKQWVKLNKCNEKASRSKIKGHGKGSMDTDVDTWDGCQDNATVALYSVKGGGNAWPGGLQYETEKQIGKTDAELNANEVIWSFLVTRKLKDLPAEDKKADTEKKPDADTKANSDKP